MVKLWLVFAVILTLAVLCAASPRHGVELGEIEERFTNSHIKKLKKLGDNHGDHADNHDDLVDEVNDHEEQIVALKEESTIIGGKILELEEAMNDMMKVEPHPCDYTTCPTNARCHSMQRYYSDSMDGTVKCKCLEGYQMVDGECKRKLLTPSSRLIEERKKKGNKKKKGKSKKGKAKKGKDKKGKDLSGYIKQIKKLIDNHADLEDNYDEVVNEVNDHEKRIAVLQEDGITKTGQFLDLEEIMKFTNKCKQAVVKVEPHPCDHTKCPINARCHIMDGTVKCKCLVSFHLVDGECIRDYEDKDKQCTYFAKSGYCTDEEYAGYMQENCRKSCKLYGDYENEQCEEWAFDGACTNDDSDIHAYMQEFCRKSCQFYADNDIKGTSRVQLEEIEERARKKKGKDFSSHIKNIKKLQDNHDDMKNNHQDLIDEVVDHEKRITELEEDSKLNAGKILALEEMKVEPHPCVYTTCPTNARCHISMYGTVKCKCLDGYHYHLGNYGECEVGDEVTEEPMSTATMETTWSTSGWTSAARSPALVSTSPPRPPALR